MLTRPNERQLMALARLANDEFTPVREFLAGELAALDGFLRVAEQPAAFHRLQGRAQGLVDLLEQIDKAKDRI